MGLWRTYPKVLTFTTGLVSETDPRLNDDVLTEQIILRRMAREELERWTEDCEGISCGLFQDTIPAFSLENSENDSQS
jgi:hypothetical protein